MLNPEQQRATHHVEGPMLVLAGAGSGKTRVVISRIIHLLNIGIPSNEILALTFTNKAAQEMRSRIESLTHQYVLTSTFHSLGARILRESITHLGYRNDFTIYDEQDSQTLLKNCLASLCNKIDKRLVKTVRTAISQAKNALLTPETYDLNTLPEIHHIFKDAFAMYQKLLKEYNAVDFDDLLYLTAQLFQTSPEILTMYQNRWTFLLIDEYQDTNASQYFLTNSLVGTRNNIFVVGDPDQSIYSWRGAHIQNILNFENDYQDAQVITLEENYRSSPSILNAANALIKNNTTRYEKNLWSQQPQGHPVALYKAYNERQEAQFVINTLTSSVETHKIPLRECVIFYRTNAQSRIFEDTLLREDIPYVIYGGLSFYQRKEIKDILALLRVATSNADYLSFSRTVNIPKRGIGKASLEKIKTAAEKVSTPIIPFIEHLLSGVPVDIKLSQKVQTGLSEYISIIKNLRNAISNHQPLHVIIQEAIKRSHYETILREDPDAYEDRKENIEALINKSIEWSNEHPSSPLSQFLEELSLQSSPEDTDSRDAIRMMTLHHGKGLEFTLAFIVGMEEDLLPHINSKHSPESLEEERRLCYVGMTRAKRFLYLTASSYRFMWGASKFMTPSRFLKEIPEHLINNLSDREVTPIEKETCTDNHQFVIGDVVSHSTFGKGIIKKCYDTSLGSTYDIEFYESLETRSLVEKYAKLTHI